ncbi:unnamed protein product [Somion occarium]|uniref:Uncharacterized protein n=1 Tax=Somion occarium TaxID=3059160 RepID=A0ABP1E5U6_9APHY
MFAVQPGDIFVCCYNRQSDILPFHYALAIYIHGNTFRVFQAVNPSITLWKYETKDSYVLSSQRLAAVNKIGNLERSGKTISDIDALLSVVEHRTPKDHGGRKVTYNCIIWTKVALRKLCDAEVIRLTVGDVSDVLDESHAFALEAKATDSSVRKVSRYAR